MKEEIYQGKVISPVVRNITQDKVNLYAEASGDFNPIHIDESFAARTPLGGTIAHGMLILSYVSEIMSQNFGHNWLSGGKFSMRFKAAARPGDTVTVTGKVDSLEEKDGVSYATCSLDCCNQKGEVIVTGEAVVEVERKGNTHGSK